MECDFNVLFPDGEEPSIRTITVDRTKTIGQLLSIIVEQRYYARLRWEQSPALHAPAPVGSSNKWGSKYSELSRLSEHFAGAPNPTEIHLTVVTSGLATQPHKRTGSQNVKVERPKLLSYLYETGKRIRFFLVRGTPGSGKTVLCKQLRKYILSNDSEARVTVTGVWVQRDSVAESLNSSRVDGDPVDLDYEGVHWLLLDEAQTTYRDVVLWNGLFKDLPENFRFVLFASYGSRKAADIVGTPNNIQTHQQMGLKPTENGDMNFRSIPGLYFLRDEYEQLLPIQQANLELPKLTPDIRDWIFEVTNSHIGAISSLLYAVTEAAKGPRATEMSMAKFLARFSSPEEAFQQCSLGSAFDRGLPTEEDLKDPSNLSSVDFCRSLLEADGPLFFEHHEAPLNAQQAHKQGWVMLDDDQDDSMGSFIRADFPSPFHRSRLSFLLLGRQTLPPAVNEMTLIKFVCKVFASFSRSALQKPQRHVSGSGSKPSIPEAQYQHEFYRTAYKLTGGHGLWLSPELGTGNSTNNVGRIDFYIMGSKKWGIEMLREGDRIPDHLLQFEQGGAYHPWIQAGTIKDYVVLDCRIHSQPIKSYPQYVKLYHIVFDDQFEGFRILNHELRIVSQGPIRKSSADPLMDNFGLR